MNRRNFFSALIATPVAAAAVAAKPAPTIILKTSGDATTGGAAVTVMQVAGSGNTVGGLDPELAETLEMQRIHRKRFARKYLAIRKVTEEELRELEALEPADQWADDFGELRAI